MEDVPSKMLWGENNQPPPRPRVAESGENVWLYLINKM